MRMAVRRTMELTDKLFGMNVMTSAFDAAGFYKAAIDFCRGRIRSLLFLLVQRSFLFSGW
jgi:hypothetical protein